MNDARVWVGVLALVCFLSGAAAGILFDQSRLTARPAKGPFGDYFELVAGEFELDAARQQALSILLHHYEADVQRIRDRHTAELLSSMEPELRATGHAYAGRLRDLLLPREARGEFDRLAAERVVDL